ncbi:hypothetical protein RBU61_10830 [Tissierella sp. MB52-C2]|uniref:hypothetical protein n=1 Tax=Tissierella sp. MB52-C2 TaxID=3070999 RepID=UPI00280A9009|nr:hypothetical protein [Tissierella sp. MB52-C2]WMM23448.1 hypothetical protein RBU61_10830 [Tissierella sp. MB52-C2]
MTYKFTYKKFITLLILVLVVIGGIIVYKEQTTNKEAPKRANFVLNIIESGESSG